MYMIALNFITAFLSIKFYLYNVIFINIINYFKNKNNNKKLYIKY